LTGDALKAVSANRRNKRSDAWSARAGGWVWVPRRLIALSVLAAAFAFRPAAASAEVLVVMAQKSPAHEEVLDAMRASLADASAKALTLRVMTATEFSDSGLRAKDRKLPELVVTLGTDAAATVLRQKIPVPTYCTFLPQVAYAALVNAAGGERESLSALYLDQPVVRQLRLIRLALPAGTRVGVVLGPDSQKSERGLRRAAAATSVALRREKISDEKQLVGALHRVLDEADILLAVPDALVFNRRTAQSVLLTSYRLGKPVAGYSRAYVTAGALLAVYSTPTQIGRQIGEELLTRQKRAERPLPAPGYPRYFSVEVNERVARSLGIEMGPEDELARRLAAMNTGGNP
jgi:ABC-type uncharacterized transport system substrate-binding protein